MSRIDEALRRASEGSAGSHRGIVRVGERGPHIVDDATLEQYPREPREHSDRAESAALPAPAASVPTPAPRVKQVQVTRVGAGATGRLVDTGATSVSLEQYRRLAATLHDAQIERGLKTVMVTSAVPREGKTLTVVNLALTLSESYGRRVLLIDADLRRPSIHEVLGISNGTGLSDMLYSDRQ